MYICIWAVRIVIIKIQNATITCVYNYYRCEVYAQLPSSQLISSYNWEQLGIIFPIIPN